MGFFTAFRMTTGDKDEILHCVQNDDRGKDEILHCVQNDYRGKDEIF